MKLTKPSHTPTWHIDPKKKNRYVVRFPPEPHIHGGAVAYCEPIKQLNNVYFWTSSVKVSGHFSYTASGDASTLDQAFYDADMSLHHLAQKAAKHYK